MSKLKAFLKVAGLIVSVLAIAAFWFLLGSCLTNLVFTVESSLWRFACILLVWWFFNVTIKLIKLVAKAIHIEYE